MDYGYRTIIALALATIAIIRAKAQPDSPENNKFKMELNDSMARPAVDNFDTSVSEDHVSNYILTERDMQKGQAAAIAADKSMSSEQKDSVLQEYIYQSILEFEYDLLRLMALSENIKFVAYNDKSANVMTIGNGLTTINGRKVRRGDVLHSEEEMVEQTRYKIRKDIVPLIAKYLPNWDAYNREQKMILVDMFWNAGAGRNVLFNAASKNPYYNTLTEAQKQEIADSLKNKNEKIIYEGQEYGLGDLQEWRNLNVDERASLSAIYANNNIVKGEKVNSNYTEKFRLLDQFQRQEVTQLLLEQKKEKERLVSLPNRWNKAQVNDSTINYTGYVAENDYTLSEVPTIYTLPENKQTEIAEKLAAKNNHVVYHGRKIFAKDIPAWYFLNADERETMQDIFGNRNLYTRNAKTQKQHPVLSGLCCELNLYAVDKSPENAERAAARIASFVRCKDKVLTGLLRRANFRAQIFLGNVKFGQGKDKINLDEVHIGALAEVKKADLTNPQVICNIIGNCVKGLNYRDTIQRELKIVGQRLMSRARGKVTVRAGARGH